MQARYLDLALSESQKMSNFLDDMLMLAKMERGKLTLTRSALFVDRIVGQVIEKFAALADAQGVTLTSRAGAAVSTHRRCNPVPARWKTWWPTPSSSPPNSPRLPSR